MSSHGKGKRLSEEQRMEVIAKLRKPNPESKRAIAKYYGVTENAIRQTWLKRDDIERRASFMSQEAKKGTFRASIGNFTALEDELYLWIETMRRAKLEVPPSLAINKALQIAATQNIPKEKFKASWQWLSKFRERKGLKEILLFGEGAGVDKEDPVLLQSLECFEHVLNGSPENDPGSSVMENSGNDENNESTKNGGVAQNTNFVGFDRIHSSLLEIGIQLSLNEARLLSGNDYDGLMTAFETLSRKIRSLSVIEGKERVQKTRQTTLHDVFQQ